MVQARKKGDDKASYGKFQKVDNFEYNAYINIMNCLGGSMVMTSCIPISASNV